MILSSVIALIITVSPAWGQQKKINLDDVKIQGEGLRGSQISLGKGDRTDLEKHLTIRKNFREDIVSALPPELESKETVSKAKKLKNK